MSNLRIGITIGDINGIGPELIIRTLRDKRVTSHFTPVIYGSSKVISYYRNIIGAQDFHPNYLDANTKINPKNIYICNCWEDKADIKIGEATTEAGKYAQMALKKAVEDAKNGIIDAIVTAPINKNAMAQAGFEYPGHTEFLTDAFNVKESLMMMVSDDLRVGLVTNHLPVKDIVSNITKEKLFTKLRILDKSLKKDFGKEKPTIAVLGLNPHAGDGGTIGKEEEEILRPVIVEAKKKGMMVSGPYAADGFFGSGQFKKFDAILAMYHDQGLVAFKSLSFGNGVNFTAGLPIVRTSPDHGTAYEIAGQNVADLSSFRRAINTALDIARFRKEMKLASREKEEKKPKLVEEGRE